MSFNKLTLILVGILLTRFSAYGADPAQKCRLSFTTDFEDRTLQAKVLGELVEKSIVEGHLEYLTGIRPILYDYKIRDRFEAANKELSRLYLVRYLQSLGLQVFLEKFDGGVNILAEIKGTSKPNEFFEVTAHYDTANDKVPGADDNGSGVTSVLEIARIFSKFPPKRSLKLVFMDMEETGKLGSQHHADGLKKEFFSNSNSTAGEAAFIGSLVIDMIGYSPHNSEGQKVVLEIGSKSNFSGGVEPYSMTLECAQAACSQYLRFSKNRIRDESLSLTVETDGAMPGTGDHGSYWSEGIPAMFLVAPHNSPHINPNYHRPTDRVSGLNWPYFLRVMRFAVEITGNVTEAEIPESHWTSHLKEILDLAKMEANPLVINSFENVDALVSKPKYSPLPPKKREKKSERNSAKQTGSSFLDSDQVFDEDWDAF